MKKISAFLVFLCLIPIYASAQMTIDATYGIDGKGKMYMPIQAEVVITNEGDDFAGHLVTSFPESYQLQAAEIYPLQLASGEQTTLTFYLTNYPEQLYYTNRSVPFTVYEGAVAEGRVVKDVIVQEKKPTLLNFDAFVIGTDSEQSFASLQQLRAFSDREVLVEKLPTWQRDMRDYAMFDSLIVDKALSSLTAEQQQALLEWTKAGGKLVVDQSVDATIFEPFAALKYESGQTTLSANDLKAFAEGGTFAAALPIQQVTAMSDQVLQQGETIVAATRDVENGQLIQTAFNLRDESLITTDGYSHVFAKVINLEEQEWKSYPQTKHDQIANSLANTNELFSSFAFSLWKVLGVLVLYILIISPLLYIILKKKDKREHAWWLVPAIALVFSVGLFFVGAKDRLWKPQLQQMMLWTVTEAGSAQYFTQSVLANKAGDYSFDIEAGTTVAAYHSNGAPTEPSQLSYIERGDDLSVFTLKDVPYWGLKSIVGSTTETEAGYFEQQLHFEQKKVTGTITNHFSFAVEDVKIWSGKQFYPIGIIEAGATVDVAVDSEVGYLLAPAFNEHSLDTDMQMELDERRERSLYSLATSVLSDEERPLLIATAATAKMPSTLQQEAKGNTTTLIAQPLSVDLQYKGELVLTNEVFERQLIQQEGYEDWISSDVTTWFIESRPYELRYHLPKAVQAATMDWQQLKVEEIDERMELKIFNQQTKQFERINAQAPINPTNYIQQDGQIIFEFAPKVANLAEEVTLPTVTMKGEMK